VPLDIERHRSVQLAVAGSWCRFIIREKYCWLAGD